MSDFKIQCSQDGPLIVQGDFQLLDSAGEPFDLGGRRQIGLCRCGQSEDKPFCDGAHRRSGFESSVVCRRLPPRR